MWPCADCKWAGSKSNLGKAAGAEVAVELGNKKLHAAVARSTFSSQNVQNTAFSDQEGGAGRARVFRQCTHSARHSARRSARAGNGGNSTSSVEMA